MIKIFDDAVALIIYKINLFYFLLLSGAAGTGGIGL